MTLEKNLAKRKFMHDFQSLKRIWHAENGLPTFLKQKIILSIPHETQICKANNLRKSELCPFNNFC